MVKPVGINQKIEDSTGRMINLYSSNRQQKNDKQPDRNNSRTERNKEDSIQNIQKRSNFAWGLFFIIFTTSLQPEIMKEYVGYASWDEVPMSERGYCFRGYNAKTVLPEWDKEEESYNN